MSQTLRNSVFHKNVNIKHKARKKFCRITGKVVCASYEQDVCITHRCVDQNKVQTMKYDIPKNIFKQQESDIFRQARNKDAYDKVKGGIMYCEVVTNHFFQLILSISLFKHGEISLSQVKERSISDQIHRFHFQ